MNPLLHDAIILNNTGAQHLIDGRIDEALPVLIRAHEAVRDHIGLQHKSSEQHMLPSPPKKTMPSLDKIMTKMQPSLKSFQNSGFGENYNFFTCPITLPRNIPLSDVESDTTTISIAAMYNLALVHHITAMTFKREDELNLRKKEMFLKKAAKVYLAVYQLHNMQEQQSAIAGTLPQSQNILLLALMNNCGHVNHLLGEYEAANACFEHLFASLEWLRSTGWWESQFVTMKSGPTSSEFGVFFETAASWMQQNSLTDLAAPAA